MSKLLSGLNRDQFFFTSLDSFIDKDNEVRVIDALIDLIDIDSLGFSIPKSKVGRPASH